MTAKAKSQVYDEQTAAAISRARSERMTLMLHLAQHPLDYPRWERKRELDKELYELTGAEIYRPLGHHNPRYGVKR